MASHIGAIPTFVDDPQPEVLGNVVRRVVSQKNVSDLGIKFKTKRLTFALGKVSASSILDCTIV